MPMRDWGSDFPHRPQGPTTWTYTPGDPDPVRPEDLPFGAITWIAIVVIASIAGCIVFRFAMAIAGGHT